MDSEKHRNVITEKYFQGSAEEYNLKELIKRYEMAVEYVDVIMFDYIIEREEIIKLHFSKENYWVDGIAGKNVEEVISLYVNSEKEANKIRNMHKKIHEGIPFIEETIKLKSINGKESIRKISLTNIFDNDGTPIRAFGISKDVTNAILLEYEKQYGNITTSTLGLNFEANISADSIFNYESRWKEKFEIGCSFSQMIERKCKSEIHADDSELVKTFFSRDKIIECFNNGQSLISSQCRRKLKDKNYHWIEITINIIQDKITEDIIIRCYVADINDKKINELNLIYKAENDVLTGFYNKVTTQNAIESFLKTKEATSNKHAFFLIDIDNFKLINDNFGHCFGDYILSQVSSRLKKLYENNDILGRIGGDEFAILMKNIPDSNAALRKAQEICNCIKESYTKNNKTYNISVSIGVAFYGETGKTYKQLYKYSDVALYRAKATGRNKFCEYKSN